MQSTELIAPLAIQTPFAINGDKNIPSQNAQGTDTSSINLGFLPITSEPLDDGGIAPERIDFNGMFYLSTDQRTYLQNGGFITYDEDVATAIGGYPQGAILNYLDSNGNFSQVQSLLDNNQYNFVTTPSYINNTYWKFVSGKPTVISVLEQIYPVGAIFLGTTSTCPMAALFGTWTLVSSGKALWTGNGTTGSGGTSQANYYNAPANTYIPAGLPEIDGKWGGNELSENPTVTKAFSKYKGGNPPAEGTGTNYKIEFNASGANTIYGLSSTVQPPAYVVNVWRRTA